MGHLLQVPQSCPFPRSDFSAVFGFHRGYQFVESTKGCCSVHVLFVPKVSDHENFDLRTGRDPKQDCDGFRESCDKFVREGMAHVDEGAILHMASAVVEPHNIQDLVQEDSFRAGCMVTAQVDNHTAIWKCQQ